MILMAFSDTPAQFAGTPLESWLLALSTSLGWALLAFGVGALLFSAVLVVFAAVALYSMALVMLALTGGSFATRFFRRRAKARPQEADDDH